MTIRQTQFGGPLAPGKTLPIFRSEERIAGTFQQTLSMDSDSVAIALWVSSLTSGNLTLQVFTVTEDNRQFPIISFPVLTAPTAELIIKKASLVLGKILIKVVTTGQSNFSVDAKGLNAGETSAKLVGASNATAYAGVVTGTPAILIPASSNDRAGFQIVNNSTVDTIYIGFSNSEATLATGTPIRPYGSQTVDLAGGKAIWAISSGSSTDVRIMEAGG